MNNKICIIGGTSLLGSKIFKNYEIISVNNNYGQAKLYRNNNIFFIQRHLGDIPPHAINYKSYIQVLFDLKIKKIISINSVGSLKESISPSSFLVPDDFIGLWNIPSLYNNSIHHSIPIFSNELKNIIISAAKKAGVPVRKKGVYFQSTGPRLETPAEVKFMANFADIVGMTLASEVTLANEREIDIASLCIVDNYANGIKGTINCEKIYSKAEKNRQYLEKILKIIINDFKNY